MKEIFKNKEILGGFDSESNYWSSTEWYDMSGKDFNQRDGFIYAIYFGNGVKQTLPPEKFKCKIRLTREVLK